eukprot:4917084-Heterocapsa_arctica.AAC.1
MSLVCAAVPWGRSRSPMGTHSLQSSPAWSYAVLTLSSTYYKHASGPLVLNGYRTRATNAI